MNYSIDNAVLNGYENMRLIRYQDIEANGLQPVKYSELGTKTINGVLKAAYHNERGELVQLYTKDNNHVGVISATRLGKSTSYVIPTVISFARQAEKKSMVISDPKGEIYRRTAETLRQEGYQVKLLNFRDYKHSECWNPLTPIFRKYKKAKALYDTIELTEVDGEPVNRFQGKIYYDQQELDDAVETEMSILLDEVCNDIDNIGAMMITTVCTRDPIWEDGARSLLKGFIHAMLEDSENEENPITEETFSLDTIFSIAATFSGEKGEYDGGYFSNRPETSMAYALAKDVLLIEARATRSSYLSVFSEKLSGYKDIVTRRITSCNSFEMSSITDGPTAIFLCYRDELKAQFNTITLFVQDAYKLLIERASSTPDGKLEVPFYFILDEFGNFAKIRDFETTISACAGRNIWFILIIQSYAQLSAVYERATADIIRDNLNVHVFFGSNNPDTLEEFSKECGKYTRISPLSAMNGRGPEIERYEVETIPVVTKSRLSHFEPGESIVTEANSGYVLFSKLERYFLCEEFKGLPQCNEKDYIPTVNCLDKKYKYVFSPAKKERGKYDFF